MSLAHRRSKVEERGPVSWAEAGKATTKPYQKWDRRAPRAAPKPPTRFERGLILILLIGGCFVALAAAIVTIKGGLVLTEWSMAIGRAPDNASDAIRNNQGAFGALALVLVSYVWMAYRFGVDGFLLIACCSIGIAYGVTRIFPDWFDRWSRFISGYSVDPFWSGVAAWVLATLLVARTVCPERGRSLRR